MNHFTHCYSPLLTIKTPAVRCSFMIHWQSAWNALCFSFQMFFITIFDTMVLNNDLYSSKFIMLISSLVCSCSILSKVLFHTIPRHLRSIALYLDGIIPDTALLSFLLIPSIAQ